MSAPDNDELARLIGLTRWQRGDLAGLLVEWASEEFGDPKGRGAADVIGHRLLEIYPEAARAGGLADAAARVLASGEPRRIGGARLTAGGPLTDIAVARLFDGVVIAFEDTGEGEQLTPLLELTHQLGRTGAWEENVRTGHALDGGRVRAVRAAPGKSRSP